jgi:hypothetical protein
MEVLAGTYYLREHPIVMLFYSGANLSLEKMEVSYLILTPGGRLGVNRTVRKIPLELAG